MDKDTRINIKLNQRMTQIVEAIQESEPILVGDSPTAAVELALVEWYQNHQQEDNEMSAKCTSSGNPEQYCVNDQVRIVHGNQWQRGDTGRVVDVRESSVLVQTFGPQPGTRERAWFDIDDIQGDTMDEQREDIIHTYLPQETGDFTQSDYDEIFQLADKHSARVWKHADGAVMIASYEVMADWCDQNGEDPDDWTELV